MVGGAEIKSVSESLNKPNNIYFPIRKKKKLAFRCNFDYMDYKVILAFTDR